MKLYSRAALVLSAALMMCVSTLTWVGSASAETTIGLGFDFWGNDIYVFNSDNTGREEYRIANDEKEVKVTAFGVGKIKAGKGCVDVVAGEVTCSLAVAAATPRWFHHLAVVGSNFDDNIELNTKLNDSLWSVRVYGNSGDDLIDAGQANVDSNSQPNGSQIMLEGNDDNDRIIASNKPHADPRQKIFTSLVGGYGDDMLVGGPGKDDFIAESTADGDDTITNAGERDSVDYYYRTDPVVVRADGSRTSGDPKAGEKDLIPSSISFIAGGKGDDTLAFSPAVLSGEAKAIIGRQGNDTIHGSGGNDRLMGNENDDTVYGLGGNDTLEGGEGNNTLDGGDGDDGVYGGDGNDDLQGGDGNDFIFPLSGGPWVKKKPDGDDRYSGGKGMDTFSLLPWGENIFYRKSDTVSITLNDVADDDIVGGIDNVQSDIENIVAGLEKDTIVGSAFGNAIDAGAGDDIVDGAGGDDRLVGSEGVDELKGDAGVDVLSGDEGDDTLDGGVGDDDLKGGDGVDTLRGGVDNDLLSGDESEDVLSGGVGDDVLDGQVGNDTLDGGDGADNLKGGDGADVLSGRIGNDVLSGGSGIDVLVGEIGDDMLDGGDGVDDLKGGDGLDTLSGGSGDDLLDGGLGSDVLSGGNGFDTLVGEIGDDTLDGGDGVDDLKGGDGLDTLSGGIGDDRLVGGVGSDVLSGGDGSDTVDYAGSPGKVRVTVDGLGDDGVLGEHDNVQGDNEVVVGSAFDDVLIGGNADDGLFGGSGDDQLDGGKGSDRLDGGVGGDSVVARDGFVDVVVCGAGGDIATVDDVDDLRRGDCETIDVLRPKEVPPAPVPPVSSSTSSPGGKGSAGQQEPVQPTVPVEGNASTLRLAFVKPVWKVVPTKRSKTADIRFTASETAKVRVAVFKAVKGKTKLVGVRSLVIDAKPGVNIARLKMNGLKPGVTYVLQLTELGVEKPASATAKLKLTKTKQHSR